MSGAALHAWTPLVADGSVRALKYSFGPGTANTMAVKRDDGSWLVVSPAQGAPASAFEALADEGGVSALVAPNAYHHLGQADWRARFPDATSYAPEGAFARLAKKSGTVSYRSIAELPSSDRFAIVLPEGQKSPDLLIRVAAKKETVWWLGDLFSNSTSADQIWILRLVGRLAGSGLGYRRNTKPGLVYVNDEAAWLASVRQAIESAPPTTVVPAHGDPVTEDTTRRTFALLGAA